METETKNTTKNIAYFKNVMNSFDEAETCLIDTKGALTGNEIAGLMIYIKELKSFVNELKYKVINEDQYIQKTLEVLALFKDKAKVVKTAV